MVVTILLLPIVILSGFLLVFIYSKKATERVISENKSIPIGKTHAEATLLEENKQISRHELYEMIFKKDLDVFLRKNYPSCIEWKPMQWNGLMTCAIFTVYVTLADGRTFPIFISKKGFSNFNLVDKLGKPISNTSETSESQPEDPSENNDVCSDLEAWLKKCLPILNSERKKLAERDENVFSVSADFIPASLLEQIREKLEECDILLDQGADGYSICFM